MKIEEVVETKIAKVLFILTNAISILAFIFLVTITPTKIEEPKQIEETTVIQEQEKQCLVEALYFEARSENIDGIHAVLSVIHNRKESGLFPSTYCEVVKQPKQFSYRNEFVHKDMIIKPKPQTKQDKEVLRYIEHISEKAVKEEFTPTLPRQILWYTTHQIKRGWVKTKKVYVKIGNHKFMK